MSPRSNGFQAISFDGGISYEANEPLIVGNAEEEEEHRLEEKAIPRFKLSALLFGLLAGFGMVLVITLSGEDLAIKNSKTKFEVFYLLWSFFTAAIARRFLRNFVTMNYWTVGGLLEEMVLYLHFSVGIGLAWTTTGAILGMRTQTWYTLAIHVVALVSCKIVVMCFDTDEDSKPSSSRRSTAKQTMTADVYSKLHCTL
jgi:hypothetical protein